MYNNSYDFQKLRRDLKNYFGTAMNIASPLAIIDLSRVDTASDEELLEIAEENGFDLLQYKK